MIRHQPHKSTHCPRALVNTLLLLGPRLGHKPNSTENGFLRGIQLGLVPVLGHRRRIGFPLSPDEGAWGERVGVIVFVFRVGGGVDELGLVGGQGDAEEVVAAAHRLRQGTVIERGRDCADHSTTFKVQTPNPPTSLS